MLITPKSKFNDKPLKFAQMGQKPQKKQPAADVDNPNKPDAADKKAAAKSAPKAKGKNTKRSAGYFAKKAATALVDKSASKSGDVGKHNNGTTTGFSAVTKAAQKEGFSASTAQKIAGAQYQKMKKAGKV